MRSVIRHFFHSWKNQLGQPWGIITTSQQAIYSIPKEILKRDALVFPFHTASVSGFLVTSLNSLMRLTILFLHVMLSLDVRPALGPGSIPRYIGGILSSNSILKDSEELKIVTRLFWWGWSWVSIDVCVSLYLFHILQRPFSSDPAVAPTFELALYPNKA